ncbi:hypothetical protein DPX16_17939 [Anabarilius grahami]|uniref:Uncharacterized protein n=1 Tax=Anabarilius grahami TaxID=495550 RepID=A0A3N0XSY0_ANAGA|nr:hypothetical protein DPX16_17939 [Anabarilius grahami]
MIGPLEMDEWAKFITVPQESHDFLEFTREFVRLAITSSLDDETLRTLFQIGATLNKSIDLPDTTKGRCHLVSGEHCVLIQNTARPRARSTTDDR